MTINDQVNYRKKKILRLNLIVLFTVLKVRKSVIGDRKSLSFLLEFKFQLLMRTII